MGWRHPANAVDEEDGTLPARAVKSPPFAAKPESIMLQSVGSCSSAPQINNAGSQAASALKSPAAALTQAVLDILSISAQGQAASTKLDADGDGDGH